MTSCTLNSNDRNVAGWIQPYLARMCTGDYNVLCLFYSGNGFTFDETEADRLSGKPLVVLDMREFGWSNSWDDCNVIGWLRMELQLDLYPEHQEWAKLDQWVHGQKVIAYFKREFSKTMHTLCEGSVPFPIHPIDLLSFNRGHVPTPRREEFLARKGGVFFCYGVSHPDRPALHGALQTVRNSASNSIGVAQRVMAAGYETDLLEQVHFAARYPLEAVIETQGQFKVSIALGGCGNKSFRTSEVTNAIPVINDVGMIYAVEFTDDNAILLPTTGGRLEVERAVRLIEAELADPDFLWTLMEGAHRAQLELEPNHYVTHHINRHIIPAL